MMRIVADEKKTTSNCRQVRTCHAPCCSERAQTARPSITNNTRHPPARIVAHPALHTKSCKGPDPRLLRFCITRRLLSFWTKRNSSRTGQQGQPFTRDQIQSIISIRITLRHKIVEQTTDQKLGTFGIFLSSRSGGSATTTKRGLFSSSFLPLAYKKRGGTHTLPLGIPRQERFLEVLNPHDCIRPEQGSKQDSGSPGTGTRQSSTGDFLFESNVDFFRQPLFPFLFPFLFFFFFFILS